MSGPPSPNRSPAITRFGDRTARGDQGAEAFVGGDVPAYRNRLAHAAHTVGRDRIDGQSGSDDEAVRGGIAAGDAQGEYIGAACLGPTEMQDGGRGDQAAQKGAAIQARQWMVHGAYCWTALRLGPKRARKSSRRMVNSSWARNASSVIWGCSFGLYQRA